MADYRLIHVAIWDDEWFVELTPQEKVLWIYLFSNRRVSLSGLYRIRIATIAHESGLSMEDVVAGLARFEREGKLERDGELLWIPTLPHYQLAQGAKLAGRIEKDLALIQDCPIKQRCLKYYKTKHVKRFQKDVLNTPDTLSDVNSNSDTLSDVDSNSDTLSDVNSNSDTLSFRTCTEHEPNMSRTCTEHEPKKIPSSTTYGRNCEEVPSTEGTADDESFLSDLSDSERQVLDFLLNLENYPFDRQKDLMLVQALCHDYPDVDPLTELHRWAVWTADNRPLSTDGKGSRPRSGIIKWFTKAQQNAVEERVRREWKKY